MIHPDLMAPVTAVVVAPIVAMPGRQARLRVFDDGGLITRGCLRRRTAGEREHSGESRGYQFVHAILLRTVRAQLPQSTAMPNSRWMPANTDNKRGERRPLSACR